MRLPEWLAPDAALGRGLENTVPQLLCTPCLTAAQHTFLRESENLETDSAAQDTAVSALTTFQAIPPGRMPERESGCKAEREEGDDKAGTGGNTFCTALFHVLTFFS